LNYKKDIELTQKLGSLFAPIISQIDKHLLCYNQNGNTAYLCHSMGNRVFLSLLHELQSIDTMAPIFHLFLCAADLPDDVLQDSLLYSIIKNTKSSSIYYNHDDRTLAVAATAVPGQRLGISGPRENPYLDNLKLVNVTHYNDFESIPGKLSLHRYFYDSPRVRKQILSTLIQN
jgi:esterase/lipase superfamily enzyme